MTTYTIEKSELKKLIEYGDFLHGHGYTKAAGEIYALVARIQNREEDGE